eukprot:2777437-Rhodomonas_salina.2
MLADHDGMMMLPELERELWGEPRPLLSVHPLKGHETPQASQQKLKLLVAAVTTLNRSSQ